MKKTLNKDEILTLYRRLESLHEEISVLVKKSPNDGVNKFKVGMINVVVASANLVMGATYKPIATFDQFDLDDLPTNSDVGLILGMYKSCFLRFCHDSEIYP